MRKMLITFLITFLVLINAETNSTELKNGNSTTITKDEIQQSGLMRLSDLFLLIDSWDVSTIDGITYQASPLGLNSYQHQEWKIFLNGNPIDIDFFGTKALDRIPVDLGQIDSIRIINQPGIYAGQKTTGGIIDIYTKRSDSGLSMNFRTGFGNETGDPGPYFYTDLSSPNVDKVGNIIATSFSYGAKDSYFNFGYKREIGYPIDKVFFRRNRDIAGNYNPEQKLESYYVDYSKTFDNFSYSISAGESEFADFLFLRQYGREIPVNSKLSYLGSTGSFGESDHPLISYRFAYSSNRLSKRKNSLNLDFDWKQEHLQTNIETYFSKSKLDGTIGIGLNHFAVHTDYLLNETEITETTIFGHFNYFISKKIKSSADIAINYQKGKAGFLALSKTAVRLGEKRLLTIALSYSKTLPEESKSIWYWQEQGYTYLEDNGVIYDIDGNIKPSKKITADISVANQFSRSLSLKLSGYYRSFSQITSEGQFLISPNDYSAPNNLIVKTDCSGQIVGGKIETKISPIERLRFKLSARYQGIIKDEILFREVWNTVPKVTLTGTILYTPVNNFSLRSRIRYNGPTEWIDYDNTDNFLTDDHNSLTVAEVFSIGISTQKYFHKRKIRTSFSIRNLFNEKISYHPLGAQFDLSYFVQIEFLLN